MGGHVLISKFFECAITTVQPRPLWVPLGWNSGECLTGPVTVAHVVCKIIFPDRSATSQDGVVPVRFPANGATHRAWPCPVYSSRPQLRHICSRRW